VRTDTTLLKNVAAGINDPPAKAAGDHLILVMHDPIRALRIPIDD